jgi:hypothetical protein
VKRELFLLVEPQNGCACPKVLGIKSIHYIFVLEGHLWEAEDLASLSVNSLSAIPVWSSTHMNWMLVLDSVREYIICLIVSIRRERCDLKILEERACRLDRELVAMRNVFGGKDEIDVLNASFIANNK